MATGMRRMAGARVVERAWEGVNSWADAVTRGANRVGDRVGLAVLPFLRPLPPPVEFDPEDRALRRKLWWLALMGFAGSALVFWGASEPSSPFTQKDDLSATALHAQAWFFGNRPQSLIPNFIPPPGRSFFIALTAFWGGLVLLMRAWVRLSRMTREHPGMQIRRLVPVVVLWILPMLFVAPVLSKDAYSYVAQGEMMTRGISPYKYGPKILGPGANSYTVFTDSLWLNVTSPYGPLFLAVAGGIESVTNHSELAGLLLFRVVALVGVALIAVFLPRLARSFGRDRAETFVFGVMNPIVLIHLVGGEHNDALMLGFLIAGLALARERHPALGAAVVALAALVKVPALLGVLYIGWDWAGSEASWRRRLQCLAGAGAAALAVMAVVTQAVGLGWGWATALGNPDTVRSYLDPATGIGLGAAKVLSVIGVGDLQHTMLTVARTGAAALAVFLGLRWLLRSAPGASSLQAFGMTMLAVVVLGPVMQPWYLAWGVILLAPVTTGRLRGAVVWLTVVVTFLGLGDAQYLTPELQKANLLIAGPICVGLLVVILAPVAPRLVAGLRTRRRGPTTDTDREELTAAL